MRILPSSCILQSSSAVTGLKKTLASLTRFLFIFFFFFFLQILNDFCFARKYLFCDVQFYCFGCVVLKTVKKSVSLSFSLFPPLSLSLSLSLSLVLQIGVIKLLLLWRQSKIKISSMLNGNMFFLKLKFVRKYVFL